MPELCREIYLAPPTSQVPVEEVNSEKATKEAPEPADTATKDDTPNDVILIDEIELTVVNSSETATEEAHEAADTPTRMTSKMMTSNQMRMNTRMPIICFSGPSKQG